MSDRLAAAWKAILASLLPTLATYVRWEYRVSAVTPGQPVMISGTPAGGSPFGTLANIALWPGPSGAYAVPQVGSLILVEFHEGNPAKPAVCGLDPSSTPTLTTLGGGSTPVAREGDSVRIPYLLVVAPAGTAGGPCTITFGTPGPPGATNVDGSVTSGSAKVVSG